MVPIHMKIVFIVSNATFIAINMNSYTLLVLNDGNKNENSIHIPLLVLNDCYYPFLGLPLTAASAEGRPQRGPEGGGRLTAPGDAGPPAEANQ